MAITRLENRTDRLFGRDADLQRLCEQASTTGLTAIIGQPQIGKSWLLMELARRLAEETSPAWLIGFTRSPKGAPDPLLQIVSDLYQRWLSDADAWQQVKMVSDQQRDRLLPAFAKFVGKLSEQAAKLVPGIGELMGTAIAKSLEGLVAANEDLRTGRLIVSRLDYDQARELVSSVHKITGCRIALMMDQWEESRDLGSQLNAFRDFLREPAQWPDTHILLGAREGGDAAELLRGLVEEFPDGACVYPLAEMDLAAEAERQRLIAFLRAKPQLSAIKDVDDGLVLGLVGGYPRVISRWVADDVRDRVGTLEGLERIAEEANEFRYADLERLLLGLDHDHRKLAVRIALVPAVEDADAWRALRPIILADLNPDALDDLRLANVLDKEAETPTFGHPTRRDAAQVFLDARRPEAVRAEAEDLIIMLAQSVTVLDAIGNPHIVALVGLRDVARRKNLGPLPTALCEAALSLSGERASSDVLVEGAGQVRRAPKPGLGLILAAGLFNEAFHTQLEFDGTRRDALLDELRTLAWAYPDDVVVRGLLANGLLNTLEWSQAASDCTRRSLLDKLRTLARAYPDDSEVRERLAMGLSHALFSRLEGSAALLDDLRALAQNFPADAAVRGHLAGGLFRTLDDARWEGDRTRCEPLLDELRALARAHPDDAEVRERLSMGIWALVDAEAEGDRTRREALLNELRALAQDFPDDAAVRGHLASAYGTR